MKITTFNRAFAIKPSSMRLASILLFLSLPLAGFSQKATVSGTITSLGDSEYLIGASIYNLKTAQGTSSNTYGFYSVTLPKDSVILRVSFVGYQTQTLKFRLTRDTTINIALNDGHLLKEIVIEDTEEIQNTSRMGTIDVPIEQIKAAPALLGEVDVLKVLQLLPGVQGGTEGSSGLYVRGGGPDQNLILLDGVPVYNASHLFGFFSVFNADAINHVELTKGGFPARYGGRLSSVIDISLKEGNNEKIRGEGSVGLIASKVTVDGPIRKGKSSFVFSARRTYLDVLTRPIIRKSSNGNDDGGYFFYDLTGKINFKLNEKNRIFFSTYMGEDKAFARSKSTSQQVDEDYQQSWRRKATEGLSWGNITSTVRWNRIITPRLFHNLTATFSRYRFSVGGKFKEIYTNPDTTITTSFNHQYYSGIRDFSVKTDFDYIPNPQHLVKFGGQAISHQFSPGVLAYNTESLSDTTLGTTDQHAKEFYVYAEDDISITDRLRINAGIHASGFYVNSKFYHSIQPRVALRYLLNKDVSLKASFAQMAQYIHLLSNVGIGLPTDLWVPSTDIIKPERSYIAAAGMGMSLNSSYELTIESYYKKMTGLIEYRDGASFLNIEKDWQTKVESGEGESYGSEIFLQKKTGRFSGWIGYTLSWTNRTFKNLNYGKTFPYKYDRRHDLELVLSYKWKENRDLSLTWVYATGTTVTLPQSSYPEYNNDPDYWWAQGYINYYGSRNSYRMRAYHRLDLSYTATRKTKWGERSWSISLYNAYSRRNPFFIDIQRDNKGKKHFVQYSLFPIIPSIAYRFNF